MANRIRSRASIFGCLAVVGILFVVIFLGGYYYMLASAATQSVVFIRAPQQGEMLEVGQAVQVRALARDDQKVTRIELWIDGQLVEAQNSNTPGGINPFPLLTTWYPQPGAHTLIARAFSSRGGTSQATVTVEAVAFADRDADGVSDETDACPDQAGNPAADGCPDRDFDGIADASDACPDEAGLPDSGCPAPSETDRDGDGVLDTADACPDEAGSPLADGCRDTDGDGIGDITDACPTEPGSGADGCPIPDVGVAPEPEPGGVLPEPLPGEEPPIPGEDVPDEGFELPFFFRLYPISTTLEIEAYEMYVSRSYDSLWCYLRLGDEDPRRYEFDTLGTYNWDIAEELGGDNSISLLHSISEPIQIWASCFGSNTGEEPENLGELTVVHPFEEWDGRQLQAHSDGENFFNIIYHICTTSCDQVVFQAPLLAPITTGPIGQGPYTLRWRWNGDESKIDGFFVIVDAFSSSGVAGTEYIDAVNPRWRSLDIADYMPACGETNVFRMKAYKDTDSGRIYSPVSNIVNWPGDPCEYTASVMFTTIDVHNPPADEDSLHRPGPIYGEFWVSNGTTIEALEFNACWCYFGPGSTFWGWCEGLKLQGGQYTVHSIFDWIETQQASCLGNGCNSNDFYAPSGSSVHLPLEDGADITIGGRIMDCDERSNPNDVLYQEQETLTIRVSDLEHLTDPIWRTLNGDHVNLNYFVRLGH